MYQIPVRLSRSIFLTVATLRMPVPNRRTNSPCSQNAANGAPLAQLHYDSGNAVVATLQFE
jgi:hypothetical protein